MKNKPNKLYQPPNTTPYLMGSVFVSGACSLALEIAGSRLIAPFYGSSIYTWSAMITVTMVALAAGYWWGGRLADRYPHLNQFARLLSAAGITVAAVPWLRAPALRASLPLGVQAGALAAAGALLGPSLLLLGALGPLVVRLTATGAADSGRKSGDAWAVSTAGSVLGAVLTGFVLIPHVPISRILLGAALVLLALGALGSWLSTRALPLPQLAACAACAVLAVMPPAAPRFHRLVRESAYGRIAVFDAGAKRYLLVNGTSQSVMEKESGFSESQYIRNLEWTLALRPKAKRAYLVGLGAGLLPKALEARGLVVDAFELDPEIERAARDEFGFAPKGTVTLGDGRSSLDAAAGRWELGYVDAFGAEAPPAHMFTDEAFETMKARLAPDGVLAVNIVSAISGKDDGPWKALYKTLSGRFVHVRAFVASDPNDSLANVLLFASDGALDAGVPSASPERVRQEVRTMLARELTPSPRELDAAVLLTDDHSPLDALMAGTARRWRTLLQRAMPEVLLD